MWIIFNSGHTSFVNCTIFIKENAFYNNKGLKSGGGGSQMIVSGSTDGTIKIWDMKTTECVHTFR